MKIFSAYDWEKFGFKHLNAGSEFVYSLKDQKVESITATVPEPEIAPFIKTVWDIIDTDGDKKLSNLEMKLAYDEPEKVEILSKLVCTHKSEWSYDIEKIKSEVQEIHNTSMGNNPSDELIKQVKSRILALETKMKELMFWKEAKNLAYTGEVDDKLPARVFPDKDNVHYFHPLSWVRHMKLILGNGGDHGDYHDPIINPQVRGWYNSGSTFNKSSSIGGWNPYASMRIHKHKEDNKDKNVREYGKPQRSTGGHGGLDIYAPVGTPIYACVDGIITHHKMFGAKAGFLTQLKGKYKEKIYIFQYLHLMEVESDRFRFYNNYGSKNVSNDGWLNYSDLGNELTDPLVGEKYKISYNGSELQIDNNIIDIDLAVSISKKKVKKGDIIGYTGSTGNSYQGKNKNHLHFGIKDAQGNRLSPYELFEDYINLDESGIKTSSKQDGMIPSEKW